MVNISWFWHDHGGISTKPIKQLKKKKNQIDAFVKRC